MRILTISIAFYSKIDTFSLFKKIQNISGILFIFSKRQKNFEDFEKTAIFSCIPLQNCYLQSFQSEFIFLENPCTFLKQPKVRTFWEKLVFQLNSTAKLLPPANFYTFKIFERKAHFFQESLRFELFEDCYNFGQIYGKFAASAILKDFSFPRKTEVFFKTSKSHNMNVLRNLTVPFAFDIKLADCFSRSRHQIG